MHADIYYLKGIVSVADNQLCPLASTKSIAEIVRMKKQRTQLNFMDGKMKLGVYTEGKDNIIGPLVTIIVAVDNTFFRRWNLSTAKQNLAYLRRMVENATHYFCVETKAMDVKQIDSLIAQQTIDALNSYPSYWDCEIHVFGTNPEELQKKIPKRQRLNTKIDVNPNKWHYDIDSSKVLKLAKEVARSAIEERLAEIKLVYGDCGSGHKDDETTKQFVTENEGNINIRRKQ